ncbi:MAG: hypothetical protein WBA74_10225, partial [Cyclobacteriaceae bacterium]
MSDKKKLNRSKKLPEIKLAEKSESNHATLHKTMKVNPYQQMADNSEKVKQLKNYQQMADNALQSDTSQSAPVVQRFLRSAKGEKIDPAKFKYTKKRHKQYNGTTHNFDLVYAMYL